MKFIESNKNIISSELYKTLQAQFPPEEMKSYETFEKILKNPKYKVFSICENNQVYGYFTYFEFDDNTILIDYFVINKEYHSKGIGSLTFNQMKELYQYNGCFLEVEKYNPKNQNTLRRINFYKKLGAIKLDINYIYPNQNQGLPMDLYFMPFKPSSNIPSKEAVFINIKNLFRNIHFDVNNLEDILLKIENHNICKN